MKLLSNKQRQTLLFTTVLALCVFFIHSWQHQEVNKPTIQIDQKEYESADWFIENVRATSMTEQGKPLRRLLAKKMLHFDQSKTTQITAPHFYLFQDDGPPWQLTAKKGLSHHGKSIDDIKQLDLWQQVTLWREANPKMSKTTMTTQAITVYPNENIARTNHPVRFHQPGQTINGTGMVAHFDTEKVNLLHQVTGHHKTQQPPTKQPG